MIRIPISTKCIFKTYKIECVKCGNTDTTSKIVDEPETVFQDRGWRTTENDNPLCPNCAETSSKFNVATEARKKFTSINSNNCGNDKEEIKNVITYDLVEIPEKYRLDYLNHLSELFLSILLNRLDEYDQKIMNESDTKRVEKPKKALQIILNLKNNLCY